jgi:hypothetical protein
VHHPLHLAFVPAVANLTVQAGEAIVSISATTTVYLLARATFTVSTMTAYGKIQAVRI